MSVCEVYHRPGRPIVVYWGPPHPSTCAESEPMNDPQELATQLSGLLPPTYQPLIQTLSDLLASHLRAGADSSAQGHPLSLPDQLQPLVAALAGKQIHTSDAVIAFGANSQMGDVTVRDVAGGDIIRFRVTPKIHSPTQHLDVNNASPQNITQIANQTVVYNLIHRELDKATEKQPGAVSLVERTQVLRRAQFAGPILQGAQILWVDDHPGNNIHERRILRTLGIYVDLARSTEEAWELIGDTAYDLVISDIKRGSDGEAGLVFLNELRSRGATVPVIFYSMNVDASRGAPKRSFAITERPDHLIHYIIDVLERARI